MGEPLSEDAAERIVNGLGLPAAASFQDLTRAVEDRHGKPIVFAPLQDELLKECTGLWTDKGSHSEIRYRPGDPHTYRTFSNAHEFSHILLNHQGCSALRMIDTTKLGRAGLGGALNIRMRALRPSDNRYGDHQEEADADLLARAMMHRLLDRPQPKELTIFG